VFRVVALAGRGQAVSLMAAAQGTRLEAYIMSLLAGLRTEEAWALRWDHVVAWVDGQWQPVAEAGVRSRAGGGVRVAS
jgi:integrase